MSRLFISYRREDAANDAGRLAEHLRGHFGRDDVFIDVDTVDYGVDFVERIQQAVGGCDVLLAVIGRGWLSAADQAGRRRLDDPDDFVRLEIRTALERNIRVVPVLVQRTSMPKAGELPADLAGLLRRNAVELRETQFPRDVDALIDNLRGARRSILARALTRPASWAIAAGVVAVLGGGWLVWSSTSRSPVAAPGAGPGQGVASESLIDVPLQLRVTLSDRFGAADRSATFTLAHKAPRYEVDERYLKTLSTAAPFEYLSSAWMPLTKGQSYVGQLQRLPQTGVKVDGPGGAGDPVRGRMEVCFERTADEVKDRQTPIVVDCEEGHACRVTRTASVRSCGDRADATRWWISVAHAEPAPSGPHWVVPSLRTLRARTASDEGVGFTEFVLTSGPLAGMREADSFVYGLRVNGTPVHIDGWPPDAHRKPFDPEKGLGLEFGLENLDFSGKHSGFEEVQVELQFSKGARVVGKAAVPLRYVALRDAAECEVKAGQDLTIRWRARYVHPRREDVYQIFLLSTPSVKEAETRKTLIDDARLKVAGQVVVAVVRPPLTGNPAYGVSLGVLQSTGQVKFTFDDVTSQRLMTGAVALVGQGPIHNKPFRRPVGQRTEVTPCRSS